MAFDPNLPNDVKQGLKNRPDVRAIVNGQPWMGGGVTGAATVPDVRTAEFGPPDAPSPAPAAAAVPSRAPVHFDPSAADVAADQANQATSMGMYKLPQGVVRSSIPGVYLARGKDGSFMASNVMGADGAPDFGGGAAANAAAAGVKSLRRPGGTSYDPRMAITDAEGYTLAPGAQGGAYDPNAGQVDASGAASLPGAATGPRAGLTYAQNSLRMNPADMITAAGVNPQSAAAAKQQLIAAMNNDLNSANPEVQEANRAALAQLQGNEQDVRQQYFGGNGSMYGALGGAGTGGAKGGIGLRDLLTDRYRNANLAERANRDSARLGIEQQQADRAAAAEDRQSRDSMLQSFYTAQRTDPAAAATIVQQNVPSSNMTRGQFEKWSNSDKGKAWKQMFQSMLDQEARSSLGSGPMDYFDRADLASGVVGLHRLGFDKHGNFAGLTDADGDVAYPNSAWYSPQAKYNMGVINSLSPQYLHWLQQDAEGQIKVPK